MSSFRVLGGYFVAVVVFATIGVSGTAIAAEVKEGAKKEQPAIKKVGVPSHYRYTAQAGDTYTQMVRKAIQTHGIVHKKELGQARIVAIETRAAEAAGWPILAEGQAVELTEGDVAKWAEAAMKLPSDEVMAWSTYVPYINFDTRAIGE